MDLIARVAKHFEDSAHTKLNAVDAMSAPIAAAIETMFNCLINGGKILACGNGGSAGDAQHFAAELIGRFEAERQELAAIALTTDTSILTAVGNDYSFSQIFSRQVRGLGHAGDVLLAISTSGNSTNVIYALQMAKVKGVRTIALTGKSGGKIKSRNLADITICVPDDETFRIQELHLPVYHMLCIAAEDEFFGD